MLRIYSVSLEVARDAADLATTIGRKDSDLARQLRRAAASTSLNLAEGSCSQGPNRPARYYNALGSARETLACIEVAVAMRLIAPPAAEVTDRMQRVIATLVRLARP
jgi:four helix bundle protein